MLRRGLLVRGVVYGNGRFSSGVGPGEPLVSSFAESTVDYTRPHPHGPRIGHAERQHVLDVLSEATSLGYLDINDYEERTTACYEAKYQRELDLLISDLPSALIGHTASHPPVPGPSERRAPVKAPWKAPGIPWPVWAVVLNGLAGAGAVFTVFGGAGAEDAGSSIVMVLVFAASALLLRRRQLRKLFTRREYVLPAERPQRTWNWGAKIITGFGIIGVVVGLVEAVRSTSGIQLVLFYLVFIAVGVALRGPRPRRAPTL